MNFLPSPRPWHLVAAMLSLTVLPLRAVEGPVVRPTKSSGTITLEQAYDRALETDQTIRIAYWEVRKANLLPWSVLTRIGPQITASGSYSRGESFRSSTVTQSETVSTNELGVPSLSQSQRVERDTRTAAGSGQAGITYQQPLIDFTVFPALRGAKISKVIARLQHQYTVRGTLYGVAQAYYEVLKQQRLVEVDREALRLATDQRDVSQTRVNVGEAQRSDALRATAAVEQARRLLIEDENLLESDRNTLRNILNFAPDAPLEVIEPPDYSGTLPAFTDLLSVGYSKREDLQVKELTIDQDIARKGEIIGEYGPRVVAQFDSSRGHTSGTSTSTNYDWQAVVSVQVPIFTGGQREIDLMTQNRQIEQTKLDRERGMKTVETDVKNAWLTVRTLQGTIKALHAQVVAAEQGYHDLENQYKAGTAISVDVLTALNDLNNARKDLAVQTYDYQVALRNLEQTSGVFQEARVQRSKIK